ncbi:LPXTG cell wall anchor domain-containing protein [Bacillus sp. Bva_UNVM-123]|uniref:LPXTG cell wall anchor domain-containing protein n=1 Tax=Bacillus sp. Bva_UNVM-123 TaxID=2829798 RepID=UPI00391F3E67
MNKKLFKFLFTGILTIGLLFGNIAITLAAGGGGGGGGGGGKGGGSGSGGAFVGAYLTTISDNASTTGKDIKDSQDVDTNPIIKLIFNKNVVSSIVWETNKQAITLADSEGSSIAIQVDRIPDEGENANEDEKRHIFIRPIAPLTDGKTYTLVIKSKLTANNGTALGKEETIMFTVAAAKKSQDAVKVVEDLITNLPAVSALKIEDKAAVEKARKEYGSLAKDQQSLVANIEKLVELESKLAELAQAGAELEAVKKVESLITNLPKAQALTMADKALVEEAQKAYDGLTATQKKLVKNDKKLAELGINLNELEAQPIVKGNQDKTVQNTEQKTEQNTTGPTDDSAKGDSNKLPKTGDSSTVWTSLFGLVLLGMGLAMLRTKKREQTDI